VVVSDECQNQGLGMELFRRVVQIARDGQVVARLYKDGVLAKSSK
jgi:hypothetical protein